VCDFSVFVDSFGAGVGIIILVCFIGWVGSKGSRGRYHDPPNIGC
jgi:hypothetical protein